MFFKGLKANNITPDRISGEAIKEINWKMLSAPKRGGSIMDVKTVIGVGKYAEKREK